MLLNFPWQSDLQSLKCLIDKKHKVDGVKKIPNFHDRHFELPNKFLEFWLFDSGSSDPGRMLVFGEGVMVADIFIFCDKWLGDGTFEVFTGQFYHLCRVHIHFN